MAKTKIQSKIMKALHYINSANSYETWYAQDFFFLQFLF